MRFHILPLVLACGCATDVASKADVRALQEQMQTLQRENTQLLGRLDALQRDRSVVAPRPAASAAPASPPAQSTGPASTLTVVKLLPKPLPPPLDVATAVQEPDALVLEELDSKGDTGAAAPSSAADQE